METAKNAKGEVKEVLGAVTGDRRVEAEGRVEQQVADPEAPQSDESDAAVGQAERDVREDHHDVPGAPADEDGPLGTT
ncbi:MAG: hypothetical protein QOF20_1763 [Acidimicrobiaceae bacterium]|nr:hypothetical protein [Acidimicrobiaceae bacterium]MDQ1366991.1 hypothetical protein [Acidimicrobiaceae bacterium]MDQ1369410.1 hypothetical protein [Acidimicrobiaceae bacterium]MDQ1377279.1 hypothetical protein [Acidimicrobiaceae bacterium]MDQ1413753.1 hypothetical protein [Acidimicrobiaceae bacterium]